MNTTGLPEVMAISAGFAGLVIIADLLKTWLTIRRHRQEKRLISRFRWVWVDLRASLIILALFALWVVAANTGWALLPFAVPFVAIGWWVESHHIGKHG